MKRIKKYNHKMCTNRFNETDGNIKCCKCLPHKNCKLTQELLDEAN